VLHLQSCITLGVHLTVRLMTLSTEMRIHRMTHSPKHISEFPELLYDIGDELG